MKIHNSLRHECMPEMVYTICKLIDSKKYKRDELRRLITLENEKVQEFNKVYKFSLDCDFIYENADETLATYFTKNDLKSFKSFRYKIFKEIYLNENTIFVELSKWFLSQGTDVFGYKSAQDLSVGIPYNISSSVEKDYVLGFRFWMSSLGIAMFQKSGKSSTMVFATNQILEEWIKNDKPFAKGKAVLCSDFFERLITECPLFENCVDDNNINLSLSMGLRTLHLNNVIQLKYTSDSGDTWHLTNSITYPQTNRITEIIVG